MGQSNANSISKLTQFIFKALEDKHNIVVGSIEDVQFTLEEDKCYIRLVDGTHHCLTLSLCDC